MPSILIVDDEPSICKVLGEILEDEHYTVWTAEDALAGFDIIEQEDIRLVFLDVLLPKIGGIEALEKLRSKWPDLEVVMISGHATIDMAVRAVKLGAFDFLEKPLSFNKVLTVCRNAITVNKLRKENRDLKNSVSFGYEIIGNSQEIRHIRDIIRQVAPTDARVLITGENGTGKELVARAIHNNSTRADKPFVELNCAAIPDTLIESELFGHEKGAFTDALKMRKGRFEAADNGTLFFDEIGDMSLSAQAKVLRAIQEQRIERLGSEKSIEVNVRILAATNKDLEKECAEGRFRQDLFFRLNVIPLCMPPLRERHEDITLLLFHFLREFDMKDISFDDAALQLLHSYGWPGNIRELRNCAERITVMHRGGVIGKEEIAGFLQAKNFKPAPSFNNELFELSYSKAKDAFEKQYLAFQMAQHKGDLRRTAEMIGIHVTSLQSKLKKHGGKGGIGLKGLIR
ncbi:MAG: sigma-54 dependent transcriptional regulator [Spirochaetaceae bacterium]|jgi:two-component system nitrogen regulation response regulator NtrX|nr:sigma-54 dependent transcriptional regulator [Spirochaetaceae bacterium]